MYYSFHNVVGLALINVKYQAQSGKVEGAKTTTLGVYSDNLEKAAVKASVLLLTASKHFQLFCI